MTCIMPYAARVLERAYAVEFENFRHMALYDTSDDGSGTHHTMMYSGEEAGFVGGV